VLAPFHANAAELVEVHPIQPEHMEVHIQPRSMRHTACFAYTPP
jgi:hypothetical protein